MFVRRHLLLGRSWTSGVLSAGGACSSSPACSAWQLAYFDFGLLNTVAALATAVFKAVLVALFFMHVKYSARLTWVVAIAGVFWLGILLALMESDYLTRGWMTRG